jgi:hypothetical protein
MKLLDVIAGRTLNVVGGVALPSLTASDRSHTDQMTYSSDGMNSTDFDVSDEVMAEIGRAAVRRPVTGIDIWERAALPRPAAGSELLIMDP